jgi:Spy/CpxP family protein refolding chaperone
VRTYALIIAALIASGGSALAQTALSTTDGPAPSGQQPKTDEKQSSPGTTGAMQNTVKGVATSPQEVREQSKGSGTSGKGAISPGTVGATPSDDSAQPKQK